MEENYKEEKYQIEINKFMEKQAYDSVLVHEGIIANIKEEKQVNIDNSTVEVEKIKNIIAFISQASVESFDLYAIEKSFLVFEKIENILLLHTEETIEKAKEVEKRIKGKYKDININLEITGLDDYEEIYENLSIYLAKYSFDRSESLIDSTQGPRMLGAVFYKFSVEQGIKLISWQAKLNTENRRIPATDKFNFIKEPQLKNYKLYNNANKLIEEYKFKEASMLYSQINNNEMALVLDKFGEIFSYNSLLDYDSWIKSIEKNISYFENIRDKSLKEKLNKYIWLFNQLLRPKSHKEISDNDMLAFNKINWNKLSDYDLKGLIKLEKEKIGLSTYGWLSTKYKKYIYDLIYFDFLKLNPYYETIIFDIINDLCIFLSENIDLITENFETILTDYLGDIEDSYEREILDIIFSNKDALYNLKNDFKHDLSKYKLNLENGIITGASLKKEINLGTKYKKRDKSKNSSLIYSLFDNTTTNYTVKGSELLFNLFSFDNKEDFPVNVPKYCGDLKKEINRLNEELKDKYNLDDFFVFKELSTKLEVGNQEIKALELSINNKYII